LVQFLADEGGSTAVEYALLASLIAMGLVASLDLIAQQFEGNYETISDAASSPAP